MILSQTLCSENQLRTLDLPYHASGFFLPSDKNKHCASLQSIEKISLKYVSVVFMPSCFLRQFICATRIRCKLLPPPNCTYSSVKARKSIVYSLIRAQSSWGSFLVFVANTCLPTSSKITGRDSRFIMSMDFSWVFARSSSTCKWAANTNRCSGLCSLIQDAT